MQHLQPGRQLVVIGGGYVGMEQAQLFAHLGTRVSVVGRLAPHAEPELAQRLREVFTDDGITVVEERATTVAREPGPAGEVVVTTDSGEQVRGAQVLVATGRLPRTDGLNLAAAGVDVDERGFVVVDQTQRTSNPRIYAAGDVRSGSVKRVAAAAGEVTPGVGEDLADAVVRVVYADVPREVWPAARLTVLAQLEYLRTQR